MSEEKKKENTKRIVDDSNISDEQSVKETKKPIKANKESVKSVNSEKLKDDQEIPQVNEHNIVEVTDTAKDGIEDNSKNEGFSFEDINRLEKLILEKLEEKRNRINTNGAELAAEIIRKFTK